MYNYKRLSEEGLLGDTSDREDFRQSRLGWRRIKWTPNLCAWAIQTVFFAFSCTVLLYALNILHNPSGQCHGKDFVPMWSPVLDAVKNTGHLHRFDGSFATPNAYKGTPSPLIDKAWDRVLMAKGGVISIDEETLHKVNASREYSVKLAPEAGGGYMASVEVLHQLHCLNMLRQATYEDYYKDKAEPWEDSPEILRYHLDHCIDNLRQKLMCEADTGILTYVWVKGHPAPFPDFSVQHKCRSSEAILDWVTEHQTYTEANYRIERQPGARELDSPP